MNNIRFVKSEHSDVNEIMDIIERAKLFQRSQNNFQWSESYPVHDHIIDDVKNEIGYVLKNENDEIIATVALPIKDDHFYSILRKRPIKYMHISRLAINDKFFNQGFGKKLMAEIEQLAHQHGVSYIAGSTNEKNIGMQKLFHRMGFLKTAYWPSDSLNTHFFDYAKYLTLYEK